MSTQKNSPERARNSSQGEQITKSDNSDSTGLLSGSQDGILSCKRHGMPAKYSDWRYSGAHGCYVDVPYCEKCLDEAEELHLEQGLEDEREGVQR